jgi:hypothetical protein
MTQSILASISCFLSQSRRRIFGAFFVGLLIQGVAHGNSVCKNPGEHEPTAVALGPVALEGDAGCPVFRAGSRRTCAMSYQQALNYCATRGGLPTIKQLALAFNPHNVFDEKPRTSVENVRRISPVNEPSFYYVERGSYVPPSDDILQRWFWSSSVSAFGLQLSYIFDAYSSLLIPGDTGTVYSSVRCLER